MYSGRLSNNWKTVISIVISMVSLSLALFGQRLWQSATMSPSISASDTPQPHWPSSVFLSSAGHSSLQAKSPLAIAQDLVPHSRLRYPLPTWMQRDQLLQLVYFPLPARYPLLPIMDAEELAIMLNFPPSSQVTHFQHGCRGTGWYARLVLWPITGISSHHKLRLCLILFWQILWLVHHVKLP